MKMGIIRYGGRVAGVMDLVLGFGLGARITAITDINSEGVRQSLAQRSIDTNFIQIMQGREKSIAPMDAGLLSCLMCLKARESAETNRFLDISWD